MIAAGYVDDKVVLARQLLRQGVKLDDMAPLLGYRSGSSVRDYLIRMGLSLPSIKGTRHRPVHSDDEKQRRSKAMKAWNEANRSERNV
jgi:hypothetical protein